MMERAALARPVFTVVGGPNGAGKSTYTDGLAARGYPLGEVVNPDVIAANLPGPDATRDARRRPGKIAKTVTALQGIDGGERRKIVKSAIWLSYDLGVNGDYEGMYAWLDNHGAKECGGSVAYLKFTHDGALPSSLKSDLESVVALNKRSRIYVIYRKDEKMAGRYLIGHRKGAPREGFGDKDETEEDLGGTQ